MKKMKRVKIINKNYSNTNNPLSNSNLRYILNPKSIKGSMLSYGCLNLTLTLEFKEKDLELNNIVWDNLKTYESLSDIINNKSFWPRIKLSSTDKTLYTLLHLNKILEKKIKIKHICLREIKFKPKQEMFKDFIHFITNINGLFLDSHPICPIELSIQFRLRYNGRRKLFVLCGDQTPLEDDDDDDWDYDIKETDNVILEEGIDYDKFPELLYINCDTETFEIEEKTENEEYNPFIDLPKEINNVNDFSFIYFSYEDYSGNIDNIFQGKITFKHLYDYFIYLTKNYRNSKIILNMGSELPDKDLEVKNLLSMANIAIYYDKNQLFQILKNLRNEEEKIKKEQDYFKHYYDNKIKNQEIKKFLDEEDKRANFLELLNGRSSEKNIFERNSISLLNEDNYVPLFRHTPFNKNLYSFKLSKWRYNHNKNKKEEEKIVKIKDNKYYIPLTKAEMFNYYKSEISENELFMKANEEKTIILLDELSKLYIVQFNKSYEKPFILDFDLKFYEQVNIHNIDKIKHYKDVIKSNMEEYNFLYVGYLLSALLSLTLNENKVSEEAALFIGYYGGQIILKKIIQREIDEKEIPESDGFYMPNLTNEEIENLIEQADKRKREFKFILDGNNKNVVKLKLYNPLLDKNALSYLNSPKNKNFFKNKGFITEQGKLLYDPVYRESLEVNKNEKKVKDEKDLIDTCRQVKTKNNFKMQENECLYNYKNKREKLNKYIVGFKQKKPDYEIYLKDKQNQLLPIIKKSGTYNNMDYKTPKAKYSGGSKIKSGKKRLKLNM